MANKLKYLLFVIVIVQSCSPVDHLEKCIHKQSQTNEASLIQFHYEEKLHELGHNFEPWETSNYSGSGLFYVNNKTFLKRDTLKNSRGKKYMSLMEYKNDDLLYLDYGDNELLPLTKKLHFEKIINTARYTPMIITEYFRNNNEISKSETIENQTIYSLPIGDFEVELTVNNALQHVDQISYLKYDELYGDVTTNFIYSQYKKVDEIIYPSKIIIEKTNGKVIDTIRILKPTVTSSNIKLLERPDDYQFVEEKLENPILNVLAYNQQIHFIELEHTNDKVMIVEFEDYMLVAEAPLNSSNGELIISQVRKIAPLKPIKYFVFGHHHPHYLGGVRAFVHKEATILCTEVSKDYVNYITSSQHTLQPDSLQLESKITKINTISDSLILGKNNVMKIYSIGDKSAHTKDYLLYYFPQERLLFQDDLCWISKDGPITKAGPRQAGLYNCIKELNIKVDTIIQSWPVKNHNVKTVIPFTTLEKSMQM